MKNIAVFFGGKSVEHDISVITGVMAVNSLDKNKFIGIPIFIDKKGEWYTGQELLSLDNYKNLNLKKLKRVVILGGGKTLYQVKGKKLKALCEIAVAVNCMHGLRGEDGSLAGLLSMCDIPLASPPMLASAVCMDKAFTKTVLKGIGVNCLKSVCISDISELEKYEKVFNYPLIVKPNKSGSSIGINKVDDKNGLYSAVSYALRFCKSVIIEKCLTDFIEINCACYADRSGEVCISQCERPIARSEILTFADKYEGGKRVFPADIDNALSQRIRSLTKKIYQKLMLTGVIRIDYFIHKGKIFVNEINTVPGSLAYYLFGNTLKTLTQMLSEFIESASIDYAKEQTLQTEYISGALSGIVGKGAKRI